MHYNVETLPEGKIQHLSVHNIHKVGTNFNYTISITEKFCIRRTNKQKNFIQNVLYMASFS